MRIAVIGTGYVGTVTAACLAWLGHDVTGLDSDEGRVEQLAAAQLPFYEPDLADLLSVSIDRGRLKFANQTSAISGHDAVFLCVGTPPDRDGIPDLSQVESAVASFAPHMSNGTVVVNKSTVPVGSANWVNTLLEEARPPDGIDFAVVSNPEFLREGSAVRDFLHPDRIVLGGCRAATKRILALYEPILTQEFPGGDDATRPGVFLTDVASAEMVKYAANAFLATKISFANEVARLCELVGADARQVLPALGADHRIGAAFLRPGVGWGGSCFGKDIAALIATGTEYGYQSPLLRAAVEVNISQREAIVSKLQRELKVLKGRRIALLGLAFKPDTDDLRDAPSLMLATRLSMSGCVVTAHDPVVKNLPDGMPAIRIAPDPYDAARRADAVVLVTDWPQFAELDPERLRSNMAGTLVVDGRNLLDSGAFSEAGLEVVGVGW